MLTLKKIAGFGVACLAAFAISCSDDDADKVVAPPDPDLIKETITLSVDNDSKDLGTDKKPDLIYDVSLLPGDESVVLYAWTSVENAMYEPAVLQVLKTATKVSHISDFLTNFGELLPAFEVDEIPVAKTDTPLLVRTTEGVLLAGIITGIGEGTVTLEIIKLP